MASEKPRDSGNPHRVTKSSRMLKTKKWMGTKFAGSNQGRKAVNFYLGEAGTELINSLQSAASVDIGDEKSKALITGVFKLSLKAKLLHDEKLISREERIQFVEPINSLSMMIYDTLRSDREERVDTKKVSLKFAQLEAMVVELLRKHIKEKNVDLCRDIFKYYGAVEFLEKFLHSPEMEEDRMMFTKHLHTAMRQRMEEEDILPPPKTCRQFGCQEYAAQSDGVFCGSNYCGKHHREQYTKLTENPSVMHFIVENGQSYKPIQDIIQSEMPTYSTLFLKGCHNYQSCKDNLRLIFAEELHDKYLGEKARKYKIAFVTEDEIKTISDTISDVRGKKDLPPKELYENAKEQVLEIIEPIFLKNVVPTEAYARYVKTRNMDYLPGSKSKSPISKKTKMKSPISVSKSPPK